MRHLLLAALLGAGACASTDPTIDDLARAASSEPRFVKVGALHPADDLAPEEGIVEVELVAQEKQTSYGDTPSRKTDIWVYNGQSPGPLIVGTVGDTLIVHFTNQLPEPTTVHWHGLDVPAHMDGSHIAQPAVQPGETFTYELPLLRAGTYWYHPHVRSHVQVERGLYGALVVRDPAAEAALDLPRDNYVLVLDDLLLDATGAITDPFPLDPVENALMQANGREGNTLLVNGAEQPAVKVRAEQPIRLRLINAANSRFMRLSIPGHTLYKIGGDGGLAERALAREPIGTVTGHGGQPVSDPAPDLGVLLTPGERADIVVTPTGSAGDRLALEWHDWPRGRHSAVLTADGQIMLGHDHDDGGRPPITLMELEIRNGTTGPGPWLPPAQLATIPTIATDGAAPLPVMFGHTPPDSAGDITFFARMIDGTPIPFDQLTADQGLRAVAGETRIWQVTNMTGGDHNFHPHGFAFQHLSTEYIDLDTPENNRVVPAELREIKDTIRIPRRPGTRMRSRTVVRLAVSFDDTGREGAIAAGGKTPTADRSGGWFLHCHLLEHAARGMGSFLEITEPD